MENKSIMDGEIPKCSKVCWLTKKPLEVGDTFYSVLIDENGDIKRRDYSVAGWSQLENRNDFLGVWTGKIAPVNDKRLKLAPNDILLELFDELADQPDKMDIRYILALLLIRRHIFRYEREEKVENEADSAILQVYSPRKEMVYSVPVVPLDDQRIEEVQEYLASLLYSMN